MRDAARAKGTPFATSDAKKQAGDIARIRIMGVHGRDRRFDPAKMML